MGRKAATSRKTEKIVSFNYYTDTYSFVVGRELCAKQFTVVLEQINQVIG